jgi:hypothetical protein
MSMKAESAALVMVLSLAACAPAAQPPITAPIAQLAQVPVQVAPPRADELGAIVTRTIRALDPAAFRAVTATALGGRVLLTGAVVKPEQRRRAERAAAATAGVAAVDDQLLLAEDKAFDLFAPDTDREAALLARLAADGKAGQGAIDLRVVNGIAYLICAPRSADEVARIKEMLTEDAAVKWVVVSK